MRRDKEHLELSEAADPKDRDRLMQRYCRGWFIESKDGKKALSGDLVEQHPDIDWEGTGKSPFRCIFQGWFRGGISHCRQHTHHNDAHNHLCLLA